MRKLILLLATLVCSSLYAFGFFEYPKYRLYSKADGLNNNTVSAIFQDKDGYLWLGTDIGLTRNDGVNFHHYPFSEAGGSFITNIRQLTDTLLWCWSNSYSRPVCFDIHSGKDIPVKGLEQTYMQSLQDFCIIGGNIYALSESKPVKFDIEYNSSCITLKESSFPSDSPVKRMFQDDENLYLVQKGEIVIYNPANGNRNVLPIGSLGLEASSQIESIKTFGDYMIVYGPTIMPVFCNLNTNRYITLNTSDPIIDIQQVDSTRFVFATWNTISVIEFDGNDLINSTYRSFSLLDTMAHYARVLKNSINEIFYDSKNQVLWAGITGRGVMKVSFRGERIKHIEIPQGIKSINGLTQDQDGYIWISTDNQGIFRSTTNQLSSKLHF